MDGVCHSQTKDVRALFLYVSVVFLKLPMCQCGGARLISLTHNVFVPIFPLPDAKWVEEQGSGHK